jgi:hypothetical protein
MLAQLHHDTRKSLLGPSCGIQPAFIERGKTMPAGAQSQCQQAHNKELNTSPLTRCVVDQGRSNALRAIHRLQVACPRDGLGDAAELRRARAPPQEGQPPKVHAVDLIQGAAASGGQPVATGLACTGTITRSTSAAQSWRECQPVAGWCTRCCNAAVGPTLQQTALVPLQPHMLPAEVLCLPSSTHGLFWMSPSGATPATNTEGNRNCK